MICRTLPRLRQNKQVQTWRGAKLTAMNSLGSTCKFPTLRLSSPFMVRFQNRCRKTTKFIIIDLYLSHALHIANQISSSYPSFQLSQLDSTIRIPFFAVPRWPKTMNTYQKPWPISQIPCKKKADS